MILLKEVLYQGKLNFELNLLLFQYLHFISFFFGWRLEPSHRPILS